MSKWKIDNWVDECAFKPIKYFAPTAVQKDLQMDLNVIFDRLLKLADDGKLLISWRIVCPECFRPLGIFSDTNIIPRYVECLECEEQEVTKDMIYPLFSISDEYKQEVTSQKKLKHSVQGLCLPEKRGYRKFVVSRSKL
mgnify:CR=1 FL=1